MAYIGNSPSSATFAIDTFSGDNTTVNFTLREAPLATSSIIVFVGGVRQQTDSYSLSSSTLVFSEAPPLGTNNVEVIFLGLGASASIPSDGSVSTIKILAGAVTGDKLGLTSINANNIVDASITGGKLASATITGDKLGLNAISGNNIAPTITLSNITVSNTGTFLGSVVEKANIVSTTGIASSTIIAPNQGGVVYFTANSVANATINFTGLSSVGVGNIASYVVIVTNNTANPKYISTIQVDGANQSTSNTFWAGGAPTTGTANTDIYSFNVIKMSATPTYNIFAQVSNFRP